MILARKRPFYCDPSHPGHPAGVDQEDFGGFSALSIAAAFSSSSNFLGRVHPASVVCLARLSVSCPSGAFWVMVDPAPMVAPAPMRTGATIMVPEPMKAPSPITVGHLFRPS